MIGRLRRKAKKAPSGDPPLPEKKARGSRRRKGLNMKINSDGSMQIRHMSDTDKCIAILPGVPDPVSMAEQGKKQVWNKLAVHGSFKGHPSGPFEMNGDVFSQIEKNFRRDGIDVPFDYEHAAEISVTDSTSKARGEAIASGWIKDVQNRADGLYGLVEWTDKARQQILSGEMKYISPAIRFGAKDGKTGEVVGAKLSSAALTLRPFLKELPAALAADSEYAAYLCSEVDKETVVALEDTPAVYAFSKNEYLPRFRSILKLDDTASADTMIDKIDRIEELVEQADGDTSATVEGVNLSSYILPLREFMRMPTNTTLSDLLDAAAEMIEDSQGVEMSDIPSVTPQEQTTQPAPVITPKETNIVMETITLAEHTVKLSDAVKAAVAEATAPLTLQLREAESAAAKALTDKAAEEAKVVALTEQIKVRDAAVASTRVEEAYSTYKDTKKLSDDDKEAMAITLSTKPELFEKLYPKLAPGQSVLLRTVTATDTSGVAKVGSVKVVPDFSKIIADVKAKNPTLDYDKQFDLALAEQATLMSA